MRKNKKLWSYALAGAMAVSNLSGVVAAPFTTIVAQAATYEDGDLRFDAESYTLDAGDAKKVLKDGLEIYETQDEQGAFVSIGNQDVAYSIESGEDAITLEDGVVSVKNQQLPETEKTATVKATLDGKTATVNIVVSAAEPTTQYSVTYNEGNTKFTLAETYRNPITVTNLEDKLPAMGTVFSNYAAEPGYKFYWDGGGSAPGHDKLVPGENTYSDVDVSTGTVKANKVPDTIEISYSLAGGTAGSEKPESKIYDAPLSNPISDPTLAHAEFLGWDLNGDTEVDINIDDTKDIQSEKIDAQYLLNIADTDETNDSVTMTALWDEAEKYTITYDANGAADITFDAGEYYSDEDSVTLFDPTAQLTAVDFKGWSTNPKRTYSGWNAEVNDDTDFVAGSASTTFVNAGLGSVTLYAIYQKKDVWTLSFDKNNGTGPDIEDVKVIDGENATLATIDPTEYERTGYHIDVTNAWNTKADGKGKSYANAAEYTAVKEDATFFVNWVANGYTINYDKNGGLSGTTTSTSATYGVDVELADNGFTAPSDTQEFAGWDRDKDAKDPEFKAGDSVTNLATGAAGDENVTLYAIWATKTGYMTINYHGNGGTGTMASEKGIQLPHKIPASTFTRENFTQIGWAKDSSSTTTDYGLEADIITSATTTIDLYAVWEGDALTVEFDPNDGEGNMDSLTFYAGTKTKLTKNEFTYAKHKFKGWGLRASATEVVYKNEEEIDNIGGGNSLYLYAIWEDLSGVIDDATTKAAAAKADPTTQNIEEAETALKAAVAAGASEEDLKTAKDDIQVAKDAAKEEKARQAAITAAGEANKAAQAADKAAGEADDAAEAVKKNPTADNIAKARKAAQDAEDAAKVAEDAAQVAEDAAENTENASAKKAALDAAADARDAAKDARAAAKDARAAADAAADEMSKDEAIEAANTAAEKAVKDPTDANIQAAKDAVAAAKKANATDDELKSANDKIAQAEAANAEAKKKAEEEAKAADDSAKGTPAPVGTELVDANGNKTGFKVTDANASAPEVEYEAPADKNATKADIPETYTDLSGNVYKVVGIDARAFKDTKVKTVTIRKNIKRIDPKAFYKSKVKNVKIKGTKLTKKMAKSFKKVKKGGWIKVSGKHKAKNKEILNNLPNVKNGKTKVK